MENTVTTNEFDGKTLPPPLTQYEKTSQSRNYGIDALRILSMLMIVILHVLGHGGVLSTSSSQSKISYYLAYTLEIASICSVNVFAMISGFLMINRKTRYSRIFNLLFTVIFFDLIIYVIVELFFPELSISFGLIKAIFPSMGNNRWYFKAYFVMYFFIPYINKLLNSLSQKGHLTLSAIILLLLSVKTLFSSLFTLDASITNDGYSLVWLIAMYVLGAYIKKYDFATKIKNVWFLLIFILACVINLLSLKLNGLSNSLSINMLSYTSPTTVIEAVSLFMFFKNLKLPNWILPVLTFISPLSFSVYIIHTNTSIYKYLGGLFIPFAYYNAFLMIGAVLLTSIAIFIICSIIEIIRIQIFKLCKINKLENKIGDFLDKHLNV